MDEITEKVREDTRAAEIVDFGRDKLPAGPDIMDADEVIVVEGRADVLNLLKYGIRNVIGMGGSKISPDIIALSKRKPLLLFIDGDRWGELNSRKLNQLAHGRQ